MAKINGPKAKSVPRKVAKNKPGRKPKTTNEVEILILEEGIPLPLRSSQQETDILLPKIDKIISTMKVNKHSFVIRSGQTTTVRKHLRNKHGELAFRMSPIPDNKSYTRVWRTL